MTLRRWAKKVPAANEARDLLTDRDYRRPTDLREGHRELFRLNDEPGEATLGLVTRTRALGHVEREHSIALLRDRSSVSDSRSSSSSTRVSQAQAWVMPAFEAIRAVRSCSHPTADQSEVDGLGLRACAGLGWGCGVARPQRRPQGQPTR